MDEYRELEYPGTDPDAVAVEKTPRDVLDVLLELPGEAVHEEKTVKLKRLSEAAGQDVCFKLQSLGYDRVAELIKMHPDDLPLYILLEGCVAPNLKNEELQAHYHAPTPAELIKRMLYPGEIEDLSREVERLSGYRIATIAEVKKK